MLHGAACGPLPVNCHPGVCWDGHVQNPQPDIQGLDLRAGEAEAGQQRSSWHACQLSTVIGVQAHAPIDALRGKGGPPVPAKVGPWLPDEVVGLAALAPRKLGCKLRHPSEFSCLPMQWDGADQPAAVHAH